MERLRSERLPQVQDGAGPLGFGLCYRHGDSGSHDCPVCWLVREAIGMCKKCGDPVKDTSYCLWCELEAVYEHNKAHAQIRAENEARTEA